MSADVIALDTEAIPLREPLLTLAMHDGRRTIPPSSIVDARQRVADGLSRLPQAHQRLRQPVHFPVSISEDLLRLEAQVRGQLSAAFSP